MEKPIRIQRKRTKGWRMPENTKYVGRGSKWGNPFRVVKLPNGRWSVKTSEMSCVPILIDNCVPDYEIKAQATKAAITCYVKWLLPYTHQDGTMDTFFQSQTIIESIVSELKGNNLACFCPLDEQCHADFLLQIANR